MTKIELWSEPLGPLVERSFRLSVQYDDFCRQDTRLNKLQQRASSVAARSADEGDRTVVRAIERLRSNLRIGPRLLCREAPTAFRAIRKFIPAEIVGTLQAKIDDRFIQQTFQAILDAADHLCFHAGLPAIDWRSLSCRLAEFPDPLVDEAEIDSLEARIHKAEEQQREVDRAEQERSNAEQAEARRKAEAERQPRERLQVQEPRSQQHCETPAKSLKATRTKPSKTYPHRAAWLAEQMQERDWSSHDLQSHGGPNHETTNDRILNGFWVQDRVLNKVAAGLSQKLRKVEVGEIPNT